MPTFSKDVVHMVHLHYSNGFNSDKEYFTVMEAQENGLFRVFGLYGKRNHATNIAHKGSDLPYGSAWNVFQKLTKSKNAKGYNQLGTTDNELMIKKQQLSKIVTDLYLTGVIDIFERDQFRNFLSVLDPTNITLVQALVDTKIRKATAA